ncbi:hypothetical protein CONCODRAFT_13727 [Conidiobolus coronatus NRRL 28638]|uniref:GST N-terminal domain-containing protein n=1 Tax=Conidiobolus coronatus (strain ATCC 28846 / CBS 209.66 / NRRL 28638) TaxID=796925 RepID=A0A137NQA5_CONC2|nr:hypothetical protein CONCODRAFT_13727 [Conidiobolus coronatus NRRL 28638]|eukprot:KXN64898.1 hypothetical protein CONCODRAFT_13727 [Conidiobolus coronatus NRRL 28638]
MIEFYQVSTESEKVSFSPFVIATELFLKHKNLDWDAKLMNYIEVKPTINSLTDGKWGYVPTLKFPNGDIVYDSLKIAGYLDEKYPDNPILINNPKLDELLQQHTMNCAMSACKLSLGDLLIHMDDASKAYFIENRMDMFQITVEDLKSNRKENITSYFDNLKPLIEHLSKNKFIDGDKPLVHDYVLISTIQFIATVSPRTYEELVENNPNEVFKNWVDRMGSLFDGFLKSRKTI